MTRDAPSANVRRLTGRLLAEVGVHPAATSVSHADVVAIVDRALEHGGALHVAEIIGERHCRVCGCTEHRACRPEPCGWAAGEDLCTVCEPFAEDVV
jgi:hypothetical protein